MKKLFLILFAASFVYAGCDLIDGTTEVQNPDIRLDEALTTSNSATNWLNGLERRAALVMNNFLTTAEIATDNVVNANTFYNQNVGGGTIRHIDTDITNINFHFNRLREQALYGIEVVIPDFDPDAAGTAVEAEFYFFKGYAHLLAAENMAFFPADAYDEEVEGSGVPVGPAAHFTEAIQAFTDAIAINDIPDYHLALARANYGAGNQTEAVQAANDFLDAADADFIRYIEFDGVVGPTSTIQNAVYDRQSFNDLQPLPRLDFLDPKYGDEPGTDQSPIPMLKAEEAHLILAEAEIADGNIPAAMLILSDLVGLVADRGTDEFDETTEGRIGRDGNPQRPNTSDFIVAPEPEADFIEGLVLDRTAVTPVPRISGTSVTVDLLDLITTDDIEALRIVYLMRQEIFFLEGRRLFDLGVRFPISENELLNNPNATTDHIVPVIPSHIPEPYSSMNTFDVNYALDDDGDINNQEFEDYEVTIHHDMNRIIATERGNRFD